MVLSSSLLFAIRKRSTYGTLVIDLEKCCPIDLFVRRTQEDVKTWLQQYPYIELVTRDGSKAYAAGDDIEKECRHQGYKGSRSTLNRLIAEERTSSSLGPLISIRSKAHFYDHQSL
ncbi:hypothetical protein [Bacillus sp. FJAT-44742]|uniref:hypothetical protein n=1 Tax=Bacillus sp. FJAT-44742 TaxID=2014005 RepID=UPI000C24870F|nr:hypothetical protein [Bacillus sp. FJAT-44742]